MEINNIKNDKMSEKTIYLFLLLYVFILLFFCSYMSPMYYSNEWADVNVYLTIGKSMFYGKVPYVDVFDHKGPFIFFLYALGYFISEHSFLGMFIIELVAWLAMVYSLYKLARLYLPQFASLIASSSMPILLIELMKSGGSAEEFILTIQCVSFYLFALYFNQQTPTKYPVKHMFIHGVLCSIVLFTKLNLLVSWIFPLAGIFICILLSKQYKNFFANIIAYVLGILLIAIPICLYFYVNNALQTAYDIYIVLNSKYADIMTLGETLRLLSFKFLYLFLKPLALFLLGFTGVFYFSFKLLKSKVGKWSFFLSGISLYIMIYMSAVYQYYYPIPILMFSVFGVIAIFSYLKEYIRIKHPSLSFTFISIVILVYIGLGQTTLEETKIALLVNTDPGIMMKKSQRVISKEPNPTLLNLGFGLSNSLFTTCEIVPNIRYFVTPNFKYKSYPEMRDEQAKYISEKKTKFVIMGVPLLRKYTSRTTKEAEMANITNYNYFIKDSAFNKNYELVHYDTIINLIDERNFDIYALYKLKENE